MPKTTLAEDIEELRRALGELGRVVFEAWRPVLEWLRRA